MLSVMEKLRLSNDEINALYTVRPVCGYQGTEVAAAFAERYGRDPLIPLNFFANLHLAQKLAERYGLDPLIPLGRQLAEKGVLTEEEGKWFDD